MFSLAVKLFLFLLIQKCLIISSEQADGSFKTKDGLHSSPSYGVNNDGTTSEPQAKPIDIYNEPINLWIKLYESFFPVFEELERISQNIVKATIEHVVLLHDNGRVFIDRHQFISSLKLFGDGLLQLINDTGFGASDVGAIVLVYFVLASRSKENQKLVKRTQEFYENRFNDLKSEMEKQDSQHKNSVKTFKETQLQTIKSYQHAFDNIRDMEVKFIKRNDNRCYIPPPPPPASAAFNRNPTAFKPAPQSSPKKQNVNTDVLYQNKDVITLDNLTPQFHDREGNFIEGAVLSQLIRKPNITEDELDVNECLDVTEKDSIDINMLREYFIDPLKSNSTSNEQLTPESKNTVVKSASTIKTPTKTPMSAPIMPPMSAPIIPPMTAPIASPIPTLMTSPLLPILAPMTSPIPTPMTSPLISPLISPILTPMRSPIASPMTSPLISPRTSPIASPIPTPMISPLASPKESLMTSPIFTPMRSPIASPTPTSMTSPITSPISSPILTPMTSPVLTPMTSPVLTPMTSPIPATTTTLSKQFTTLNDYNKYKHKSC